MAAEPELYDAAPAAPKNVSTAWADQALRHTQRSWSNGGPEILPADAAPLGDGRPDATAGSRLLILVVVGAVALVQVIWLGLLGYLVLELLSAS